MQSIKVLLNHQKSGDVGSIINGMNDSIMFTRNRTRTVVLNVFIVLIVFLALFFNLMLHLVCAFWPNSFKYT